MEKKTLKGYPDRMPSLSRILRLYETKPKPKVCKNRRAEWINEFFLVEILLRSKKAKEAYRQGGEAELTKIFQAHNVFDQQPLKCSHHRLLTAPEHKLSPTFDCLGTVDSRLGIQDLGVIARLTPDTVKKKTRGTLEWPNYDGERAALALLLNPSPRFVCLRFDMAHHSAETILDSPWLRHLLRERHKQAKTLQPPTIRLVRSPASGVGEPEIVSEGPLFAFSDRQRKWTPFKDIPGWLTNLKCYDLCEDGHRPDEIVRKVCPNGVSQYYSAIKKIDKAIKSAENGTWPPSTSRRIS